MFRLGSVLLRGFDEGLRFLNVLGIAILLILGLSFLIPVSGKALEWAQYLAVGLALPPLVPYLFRREASFAKAAKLGLIDGLFLGLVLLGASRNPTPFLRGVSIAYGLAFAASYGVGKWDARASRSAVRSRVTQWAFLGLTLVFFSWMMWWDSFWKLVFTRPSYSAVFLGGMAIFYRSTMAAAPVEIRRPGLLLRISRLAGYLGIGFFFAFIALRQDHLFRLEGLAEVHNWGVYLGPVAMVRQGGWLLWDVPSQYGFLNILLMAALPFASVWKSMYFCNAALVFASSLILFFLLIRAFPGKLKGVAAFLLTWAVVFLLPGWPPELVGLQSSPSMGALRFIWIYVLSIHIYAISRPRPRSARWRACLLAIGTGLWLLGVFWSVESAIYCTAIWGPAYLFLGEREWRGKPLRLLLALLSPLLALGASLAILNIIYVKNLGHGPDGSAFFEYARAFKSGSLSLPIWPSGAVWTLLVGFCALLVDWGGLLAFDWDPGFAACASCGIFGFWSAASYFVGRGHDNNALAISPFLVMAIALRLQAKPGVAGGSPRILRTIYVGLFTVLVTIGLGNWAQLSNFLDETMRWPGNLDDRLPLISVEVDSLIRRAGILPDTPLLLQKEGQNFSPIRKITRGGVEGVLSDPPAWLPLMSMPLFIPLSDERKEIYIDRFTRRRPMEGWILSPKGYLLPYWVADSLARTHVRVERVNSDSWSLDLYRATKN